ncbi:hypothetical protein OAJ95_02750 [Pelagibacteraceae bacterium]|nr:hypothetical protein [Pelagibacteraceae bacterium]
MNNKPCWKYLDDVGENTAVIISDAENFPKFFVSFEYSKKEMKEIRDQRYPELKDFDLLDVVSDGISPGDDHFIDKDGVTTSCIKNKYYTGYEVQREFTDISIPVLGKEINKPSDISIKDTKVLTQIFIFGDSYETYDCFNFIDEGYEIKKTKVCQINIYSKKLGIGLDITPIPHQYSPLPISQGEYDCYLGNGSYNIYAIELEKKKPAPGSSPLKSEVVYIGVLIELNSIEKFSKDDLVEILSNIEKKFSLGT